jgi:hypothetical protein
MAGFPQDKTTLNQKAGQVVVSVYQSLQAARDWKAYLDRQTDAVLGTSGGMGFTAGEITVLRAGATDMNALWLVATAQQSTGVNNFFFNARELGGVLIGG